MSIRLRLTLWYSGLLAATLLAFGIAVYGFIHWNTYSDLKEQIKAQSEKLGITASYNIFDMRNIELDLRTRIENKDMYVQLVSYETGIVKVSSNMQNNVIPYPKRPNVNTTPVYTEIPVMFEGSKYKMITYQTPVMIDNRLVGLLQVGAIPYNEEKILTGLRNTLVFSSLLVIIIAFTVGMLIARQALRPIGRVIHATQQIEKGTDLSVRIPSEGPRDEIGTLVNTLNSMLGRLEKAYNELDEAYMAQRRFVSDASHELRTPLTTIRGNIDLLEKMWGQAGSRRGEGAETSVMALSNEYLTISNEAMSDISAEAKRMSTLVGDLLALARADAGYVMEKEQVLLLPLTEEVVRRAGLLPRQAEWKVGDLSQLESVQVYGNHEYLQQLLFIFIENGFKYTPSGYVELSAVKKDRHIGWMIRDTGIGMNSDEIPHIFDRFYRADESRGITSGTGLGLSIAKWILDEHGGSVEVVTREDEGSTFTIWLPIDFPERNDSSIIEGTDSIES
ncbi:sensor histidine kinase [Paenibacillus chungangensis]|uniref:histidine kinase n=1 Tax=Paenibacillus chungangensis TaxID=696535 RepID=A0ABW3HVI7_9BACL